LLAKCTHSRCTCTDCGCGYSHAYLCDFANTAKEKGFSYDSLTKEPAPEGMVLPRYQLALVRDLPFDIELLDLVDQYITNLCEPYEGEFRSIETDVV
jgi:hypothetical protein